MCKPCSVTVVCYHIPYQVLQLINLQCARLLDVGNTELQWTYIACTEQVTLGAKLITQHVPSSLIGPKIKGISTIVNITTGLVLYVVTMYYVLTLSTVCFSPTIIKNIYLFTIQHACTNITFDSSSYVIVGCPKYMEDI